MLEKQLTDLLQSRFGLSSFRKGQMAILSSVFNRKDALAVLPTGGGKSLCYQLPAIHFEGLVVVVSPLIALMNDQVRLLQNLGIQAGCIHSAQTADDKRDVFARIKKGGAFVLYVSPERVQNPGFADWIKTQNVVLFAIDEAHCVSQWGPDFREDYHKLKLLREIRPDVPVLALTATATPTVLKDVGVQLGMKEPDRHVHGFYRPNLYYQVETCKDDSFKFLFLRHALRRVTDGRVLIYCGTRQTCEDLSLHLSMEFGNVDYYHAGRSAEDRKAVQEKLNSGEVRIVAATNAFGMGIDYPDVRLVVHYQMPANIESFYQEMGRAGRDGVNSRCLLLYSKKDKGLQAYFIEQSSAAKDVIRRRWDSLNAMINFAEGGECRHAGILTYFKDSERINECGHCDVCKPNSEMLVARPAETLQPVTERKAKTKTRKTKPSSTTIFSAEIEARRIVLKDWRKQYAKENDLPAFMVFSDRTLTDLAVKNPKSSEELGEVYGFGPAKVEAFSDYILRELGHR